MFGGISLGSDLVSLLLALTRCSSSCLLFQFLARLSDPIETCLMATQFIGEITGAVGLTVAPILLGIEDVGLAHQGGISCASGFLALNIRS